MNKDWMVLLQQERQLGGIVAANNETARFGLSLSEQEAKLILSEQRHTLKEQRRIEFGEGIAPKIIHEFCDSAFIDQNNYVETIIRLQEIFYLYKNEMLDEITDDELLEFMKEQFENVCFGDLDYLESTCLNIFAQAIRAGYSGFTETQGRNEWAQFDIVERWSRELYLQALGGLI